MESTDQLKERSERLSEKIDDFRARVAYDEAKTLANFWLNYMATKHYADGNREAGNAVAQCASIIEKKLTGPTL